MRPSGAEPLALGLLRRIRLFGRAPRPRVAGAAPLGSAALLGVTRAAALAIAAPGPILAIAPTALGLEAGGNERLIVIRALDLEQLRLRAIGSGWQHRLDGRAVEAHVDIEAHHITHRRAVIEETGVQVALGLAGPDRPPGPGPVAAVTGQLDLDTRHRRQR